jgi:hypothetical protein
MQIDLHGFHVTLLSDSKLLKFRAVQNTAVCRIATIPVNLEQEFQFIVPVPEI